MKTAKECRDEILLVSKEMLLAYYGKPEQVADWANRIGAAACIWYFSHREQEPQDE